MTDVHLLQGQQRQRHAPSDDEDCWRRWQELAAVGSDLHWLAVVDSAQDTRLPRSLTSDPALCHGLLGASLGSPIGEVSPWMVELPRPGQADAMPWRWIIRETPRHPASLTVMASRADATATLAHLEQFTNVRLADDDDSMVLALWDPAILGSLCGQPDDQTLHVPGPILTTAQRHSLMAPLAGWWYCDREGHWHEIAPEAEPGDADEATLCLSQEQTDWLVEASVPDHVLYHVNINQPLLLESVPRLERYRCVRRLVVQARDHGLQSQRDLVNFCCVGLIYGARLDSDPSLQALLQQLKRRERSLDDLLPEFPE